MFASCAGRDALYLRNMQVNKAVIDSRVSPIYWVEERNLIYAKLRREFFNKIFPKQVEKK